MKSTGKRTGVSILVALSLAGVASITNAASHQPETIEVVATEFAFEPSEITVTPGAEIRIRLINDGSLSHNLHIDGEGIKTETLQTGSADTITVTAPEDGKLHFFCNVPGHKQAGMTGRVTVDH